MRAAKVLMLHLDGHEFKNMKVSWNHQGSTSIFLDSGFYIHATPDWEEDNSLPIDITREDGDLVESVLVRVIWTSDEMTNLTMWEALVYPYVLKYSEGIHQRENQ